MTTVWLGAAKAGVVSALRAIFNFLALNIALVAACTPVVTVPLALEAATVALERWRLEGEDRVVKEFIGALRARASARAAARAGAPLLACFVAIEEVHFFVRGGGPVGWACLGCGLAALVVSLSSCGYALLLGARQPAAPLLDVWSLAVNLAVRNVAITGPLFLLEATAAGLLGFLDPALVLIGLPLLALQLVRLTAQLGARRAPVRAQREPAG